MRSLVRNLVIIGSIKTTKTKAKAVQPMVDKIMTKVKRGTLSERRAVVAMLGNDGSTVAKIYREYAKPAASRSSGFTKITNLSRRRGDNAQLVRLEWSDASINKEQETSDKEKTKE